MLTFILNAIEVHHSDSKVRFQPMSKGWVTSISLSPEYNQ